MQDRLRSWLHRSLLFFGLAAVCAAQAWVPSKGEGEFSIAYENLYTRDHLDSGGNPVDVGTIRVLALAHSLDFGVTDKLAVSASLPLVVGKYDGAFPHLLPIDNGNYHGGVGDFRLAARYEMRERPFVITPYVGVSFPAVQYQHFAHSAIGSDMWEVGLGVNVGRRLDPWLPNGYFQTRYTYVITQNVSIPSYHYAVRPNRSRVDAELGYFLTQRLSLRGLANAQVTHGGLDFNAFPPSIQDPSNDLWHHHDQISTFNYLNAGAGLGFAVTNSIDVFASFEKTAWGENTHALNAGIVAGVSWSFQSPWGRRKDAYVQDAANWRSNQPKSSCAIDAR